MFSLPNGYFSNKQSIEQFFSTCLLRIDNDRPIERQIIDTHLNFVLELKPIYLECGRHIKGNYAVMNSLTGEIFDVVSEKWKPHQPVTALSYFQDWCKETGLSLTHAGSLDGGRIVFALADYPDMIEFGSDATDVKVLLSNFNKLGVSTKIDLFTYRLVCKNGLAVKNKEGSGTLSHLHEVGDRLNKSLDGLHSAFTKHKQMCEQLTKVSMNAQEAELVLIKTFGDPDKERDEQPRIVRVALDLFKGRGRGSECLSAFNTAYGLLQSVTEYHNHHSRKTSSHLSSLLYGSKNESAQKIVSCLERTYLS